MLLVEFINLEKMITLIKVVYYIFAIAVLVLALNFEGKYVSYLLLPMIALFLTQGYLQRKVKERENS